MNSATSTCERTTDIRTAVASIIMACPLEENFKDCPAFELRQKSMQDRLAWVMGLSEDECEQLYQKHLECFSKRTNP